jgi:hypothetical protein
VGANGGDDGALAGFIVREEAIAQAEILAQGQLQDAVGGGGFGSSNLGGAACAEFAPGEVYDAGAEPERMCS